MSAAFNLPKRVVSVDLEATGFNVVYDVPVQIAVTVMENGAVIGEPFHSYILPDLSKVKISMDALIVNAGSMLTDEGVEKIGTWINKIKEAPTPLQIAADLVKWAETHDAINLPNIAHKADFDFPMMVSRIFVWKSVIKKPPLSPVWIDTLAMAQQQLAGELKGFGLTTLCAYFDFPRRGEQHNALQDAILGGQVYHKLRELALSKTLEGVPA